MDFRKSMYIQEATWRLISMFPHFTMTINSSQDAIVLFTWDAPAHTVPYGTYVASYSCARA